MKIFDSITAKGITIEGFLIIILCSLVVGTIESIIYLLTHRKDGYNYSMPITILVLPVIVSLVLALVGNNVAGAFSLMGVFSLIRFRSEQGSLKDIAYLFLSVASGLAMGLGYIGYGFVVAIIMSVVLVVLAAIKYGEPKRNQMRLKIIVPEDLNYEDAFTDILEKNTKSSRLEKVRTSDFGTMFELTYTIYVNDDFKQKQFIDEIRCRNGNLNVSLTVNYKISD